MWNEMKMSSWKVLTFFGDNMHILLVIFFLFEGFCQESKEWIKDLNGCVPLGSLNTTLGIYKLWRGPSVLYVGFSIQSWTHFILHTSLVFQSNSTVHLVSVFKQEQVSHFTRSRVPVQHHRPLEVCRLEYS